VRVRIAAAVLGCTLLGASGAAGQPAQLAGPAEVVIFVPNTLKSTDFIEPLVCALKRVLVAPVSTLKIGLPLSRDMLATATQYDVRKVAESFEQATAHKGGNSTFKYLLLPYDLKDRPYNYVFATSYGNRTTTSRLGIISTARLDVSDPTVEHHTGADLTALRVYKLMLKSIARLAGLQAPIAASWPFQEASPNWTGSRPSFVPMITRRWLVPQF
jgi:hypothetical protein